MTIGFNYSRSRPASVPTLADADIGDFGGIAGNSLVQLLLMTQMIYRVKASPAPDSTSFCIERFGTEGPTVGTNDAGIQKDYHLRNHFGEMISGTNRGRLFNIGFYTASNGKVEHFDGFTATAGDLVAILPHHSVSYGAVTDAAIDPPTSSSTFATNIRAIRDALHGLIDGANRIVGKPQIFQKAITSAANAGFVNLATVTGTAASIVIDHVILKAVAAAPAAFTSGAITAYDGATDFSILLSAASTAFANLNAANKQAISTQGGGLAELGVGNIIRIELPGSGATPVNFLATFVFRAAVNGSHLV